MELRVTLSKEIAESLNIMCRDLLVTPEKIIKRCLEERIREYEETKGYVTPSQYK